MSIEKVQERIIKNANLKASESIKNEEERLNKLMNIFLDDSRLDFEQRKARMFEEIDRQFKRKEETESVGLERAILVEKTRLIDVFFEALLDDLVNMNDEDYYSFLCSLVEKSSIKDSFEVRLNERDLLRFGKKMSSFLSKHYREAGKLSDKGADIKGGCIVVGNEVELDYSFESIITELRENYEVGLNESLFKES
ncbi:MAG: V-type ATP synthase subunit E [Caldisericaceae bacterium]